MVGNAMLRNVGKTVAYVGVVGQVWIAARNPFTGNMIYAAHALCMAMWISGLILFRKNLDSK